MSEEQGAERGRRNFLGKTVLGGTAALALGAVALPKAGASEAPRKALQPGDVHIPGPTRMTQDEAAAGDDGPRVHTREEWRALAPTSVVAPEPFTPGLIVIHHMANQNVTDDSQEWAFEMQRRCQHSHMNGNGWRDIGQQLTISRGGHLMEGRDGSLQAIKGGKHVVGAHTANWNTATIGIENEGTYTSALPTDAQWDKLVETCAWLCKEYGLAPMTAIVAHRDLNQPYRPGSTLCPGNAFYKKMPQLRADVATRMGLPVGNGSPNHVEENISLTAAEQKRLGKDDHGSAVGDRDPKP
ncbi:peptidoglycan recognition family protein [Streptomyces pathocidini]|uniref:Peptidoglycan recognition family protein n=1 Tax=Streptomyces pathocidini TaxID=1650571 RepID=A0ABW7USF2_9ACTN|nr:peptidoglycan recognition family protein [Streptomyces pathocidini]